ncbi:hypothetical protein BRADI_4g45420v3 [Brachypodium distachyon]|uniref:Proliferating cell nuclear antigen PCNA N-terminal domain-containing protein n=1 Tax=Brachypodium distachyon TaxID=15368 RepID=A0A2K2CUD0_BRADI|nr:hypothetical protein BRADI_4g45420v3 [Brachypodium distachyon]
MPWRRSATCSVRPSSTSPIRAMDTSGVALQLRAEAFNHYRCDGDLTMGLDLAELAKAFCCANNDDIITMEAEEGWFDLLVTFEFESPEYGEIKKKKFDFLDVNGVPIEIPESLESEAIVRMPSAKFMRICNQLSSVGDRGPSDTVSRWIRSVSASSLGEKLATQQLSAGRPKLLTSQKKLPL